MAEKTEDIDPNKIVQMSFRLKAGLRARFNGHIKGKDLDLGDVLVPFIEAYLAGISAADEGNIPVIRVADEQRLMDNLTTAFNSFLESFEQTTVPLLGSVVELTGALNASKSGSYRSSKRDLTKRAAIAAKRSMDASKGGRRSNPKTTERKQA